jgi:uncharacterized BrkB/YihY/UPF0761 family membrane protein
MEGTMMYLFLIWAAVIVGGALTVLLGMALQYNNDKTKGR